MKTRIQVVFTVTGEIDEELRVAPRVHKALRDLMQQIDVMPAYSGLDEKAIADRFKSDDGLTIKIDIIHTPTVLDRFQPLMQKDRELQGNPNIDHAMGQNTNSAVNRIHGNS